MRFDARLGFLLLLIHIQNKSINKIEQETLKRIEQETLEKRIEKMNKKCQKK